MDYIELGPTPAYEDCAQVGADDYAEHSRRECNIFKRMLERLFHVPDGLDVCYVVRTHPHDFGSYREVAVRYAGGQKAYEFALHVEGHMPEEWDAIAKYELAWYERKHAYAAAVREGRLQPQEVPPHYGTPNPPSLSAGLSFSELMAAYPL